MPGQVAPLTETTNGSTAKDNVEGHSGTEGKPRGGFRQRKQRGPPEDGIESKTKVMVANLPYDYTEEKVSFRFC